MVGFTPHAGAMSGRRATLPQQAAGMSGRVAAYAFGIRHFGIRHFGAGAGAGKDVLLKDSLRTS